MKSALAPSPLWTALPAAAELLADCAVNPPKTRYVMGVLGPDDGALQFSGKRVRNLDAIWRAERDPLFGQAAESGDYSAFAAHCRFGVQQAIAAAIFAHSDEGKQVAASIAALAMLSMTQTEQRRAA